MPVNLSLLCLAFPGSRCQASTFQTLPSEEPVWSSMCSKGHPAWKDPAREEGAAGSPGQSIPPAHTVPSQSISALAWRRAPRAIPDLNVLFVRLALGRSSPSAGARLQALTRPRRSRCSAEGAPACLQLLRATRTQRVCGAKGTGDGHSTQSHPNTRGGEQPVHTDEAIHT